MLDDDRSKSYRSRNNNRRAYIFNNVFFDLANSTRLIPVTIKTDRKALYMVFSTEKNLFIFISYFTSTNYDFQAEGWLVEKVRSEKFVTRSRRCMNHLVRIVNGERVVSQIRNDFTVSSSNISLDVFPS